MKNLIKNFFLYLYFHIYNNFIYFLYALYANLRTYFYKKKFSKFDEIKCEIDLYSREIICIFSHYSSDDKIADYTVPYVRSLCNSGCAIIFVSTAKKIDPVSLESVRPYISSLVIRPNEGYDFGSFLCGYELIKSCIHHKYLVFSNDSVYGPLHSLNPIFDFVKQQKCDVAGFTDSWQGGYHLQSYFLIFTKKVFTNQVFIDFFKNFKYSNNKFYIINKYEIGLSSVLINNNFNLQAICNYHDLVETYCKEFPQEQVMSHKNSTHNFWRILIQKYKYPFLKRELILYNPSKINDLHLWKSVVKETNYDSNLIENNMKILSLKGKKF